MCLQCVGKVSSICLVHMNVFAKFDEIPSQILKDIKETKCHGNTRLDDRRDGHENSIPAHKHSLRGYNKGVYPCNLICVFVVWTSLMQGFFMINLIL